MLLRADTATQGLIGFEGIVIFTGNEMSKQMAHQDLQRALLLSEPLHRGDTAAAREINYGAGLIALIQRNHCWSLNQHSKKKHP